MGTLLERHWQNPYEGGLTRQDRRDCSYDAYLPDPLAGWVFTMPASLAADIADAEEAVSSLNLGNVRHVSLEGLARFLLRAESVASSWIEGLAPGLRRLVAAEFALGADAAPADPAAVEVIGNITAMEAAVGLAVDGDTLTLEDLLTVHSRLLEGTPQAHLAGRVREAQNWVGGSSYNPCSAGYVPPPPEYVHDLLSDLVAYMNGEDHSPIVQAALAHAQFEAIHPFADGNGRTGRALIHIALRRRGLAPRFVPPVSLVLATRSRDYIAGLNTFCHLGAPDGDDRSTAAHEWLSTFVGAVLRSCRDAEIYATRIGEQTAQWRQRLGTVKADSTLDLLLDLLPGVPLLTVDSAREMVGRSVPATTQAVNRLLEAEILRQRNLGRERYRVFEVPDVLRLFNTLEQTLAASS